MMLRNQVMIGLQAELSDVKPIEGDSVTRQICLEYFRDNVQLAIFAQWLILFKKLEGRRVVSVSLTNEPDAKRNPRGTLATLEIKLEEQ